MLTTVGIAFFAASEWLATAGNVTGVVVSWRKTTPVSCRSVRPSRSGRSVATTNNTARQSVQACAKSSQSFLSTIIPLRKRFPDNYKRPARQATSPRPCVPNRLISIDF